MYIIQFADLHIGSELKCSDDELTMVAEATSTIKRRIKSGERIIICVCGDIIDSKGVKNTDNNVAKERYDIATQLFANIKEKLQEYRVDIHFCLGNHDTTHISEFFEFTKKFDKNIDKKELYETGYFVLLEDIYYVFINSCSDREYKYGKIDYGKVRNILDSLPSKEVPVILVLHHTVISMYENDTSSIMNSSELLNIINSYNIIGVLHGHIHGSDCYRIGEKKCLIIGTGALFSRNNPDVNSQFKIIEVGKKSIRGISQYYYNADNKISGKTWNEAPDIFVEEQNIYSGNMFSKVYDELMDRLDYHNNLNNVFLQVRSTYLDFKNDLHQLLDYEKVTFGGTEYSYFELAEMWEKTEIPPELYFNHGFFYHVLGYKNNNVDCIKRICDLLAEKPTGNRAVLTTCGSEGEELDNENKEYMPSLLTIQFGINDNTLNIFMYLRALEASRFLKINICEIVYLLEEIEKNGIGFSNVNIIISAFKVNVREKFNCFFKAEIDMMEDAKLMGLVFAGDTQKICELLEDKKNAVETINNVKGIGLLYRAIKVSNDTKKFFTYSDSIVEYLDKALKAYEKLDEIHNKKSIRTEEEKAQEKKINENLGKIIEELRG